MAFKLNCVCMGQGVQNNINWLDISYRNNVNSVGVMFGLQKTIKLIIHNPYIDRAKERELYIIQFSIGNISLFHTTPIRGHTTYFKPGKFSNVCSNETLAWPYWIMQQKIT